MKNIPQFLYTKNRVTDKMFSFYKYLQDRFQKFCQTFSEDPFVVE